MPFEGAERYYGLEVSQGSCPCQCQQELKIISAEERPDSANCFRWRLRPGIQVNSDSQSAIAHWFVPASNSPIKIESDNEHEDDLVATREALRRGIFLRGARRRRR